MKPKYVDMINKFLNSGIDIISKYNINSEDGKIRQESWVIRPAGVMVAGFFLLTGYLAYRGAKIIAKEAEKED